MLKLGYLIPTRESILSREPSNRGLLDGAQQAQALGFYSVWVGDSLLTRPRDDPLTLLSAIASVFPYIKVGTKTVPGKQPPIWLASDAESRIRRVAKYFDGWFPIDPNAEVFQSQPDALMDAAAKF